jgi:hypothetical protein
LPSYIEQLSNDNFKVREKATRRLLELEEVPPELRKAAKSSDVEVQRRVVTITDKIEQRIGRRALENIGKLAENGEFDEAVERLVRWQKADPEGPVSGRSAGWPAGCWSWKGGGSAKRPRCSRIGWA